MGKAQKNFVSVTEYLQNIDESVLTAPPNMWSAPPGKLIHLHGGHTTRADCSYGIVIYVGGDKSYHASVRNANVRYEWRVEEDNPDWRPPTEKEVLDKLRQEAGC